jgi:predicted phage tail protein
VKIYKKIVYDKDDNIIESESYEYHGEVAQAGGSVKKIIIIAAVVAAVVVLGPTALSAFQGANPFIQKALISLGTSIIGGLVGQKLAPKIDPPNFGTSLESGISVTAKAPTSPYRVIYGTSRVGGTIVYAETTSSTNEFLHMVIVFAGHEVDDISTIYLMMMLFH